jgi:hypothetical protein
MTGLQRSRTEQEIVGLLASLLPQSYNSVAVPDSPGLYSWWARTSALRDAEPAIPPVRPAGVRKSWALLYVGIAPRDSTGKRTLIDRLNRDHHGGNIGGSTLRLSLASLLRNRLSLTPKLGHDRARIVEEEDLTRWIDTNLGLTLAPVPEPWDLEVTVIRSMNPPLNLVPGFHPFRHVVRAARDQLRAACRQSFL